VELPGTGANPVGLVAVALGLGLLGAGMTRVGVSDTA
jgi:hypothetical protein